jgi:hypothetical protein
MGQYLLVADSGFGDFSTITTVAIPTYRKDAKDHRRFYQEVQIMHPHNSFSSSVPLVMPSGPGTFFLVSFDNRLKLVNIN